VDLRVYRPANVSEKHTLPIIRAEDGALKMETTCFSETLVSANKSTHVTTQKNIVIFTAVRTSNLDSSG
jgi:hypothetical protein